jgi:hypothetical protein
MKKQTTIWVNLLTGGVLFGLSVYTIHQTSSLSPGVADFPRFLGFLLFGLNILFIITTLRKRSIRRKMTDEKFEHRIDGLSNGPRINRELYPFTIIIFCAIFIYLMDIIGFEISACILILLTMCIIDRNQVKKSFYLILLAPAVLIIIFKLGMGLRIPLLLLKLIE